MIRIHKPANAPAVLSTRGKNKRRTLCSLFTRFVDDYRTGTRKLKFDSGIYGHKSVKRVLIDAQHKKCAFCESKIRHISYGDVEHFRPKGGVRQSAEDDLVLPGYYWLAYDWDNLLLSCQLCNQRFKQNLFPLANPRARAGSHRDDLSRERPLLINPAGDDDPEGYIAFHQEMPYAIGGDPRGRETITVFGLDREELNEMRRSLLQKLESLQRVVDLAERPGGDAELGELADEAKSILADAKAHSAQYAAMVRANFPS